MSAFDLAALAVAFVPAFLLLAFAFLPPLPFLSVVGFLPADATSRVGAAAMVAAAFGACVAAAVALALAGFTCAGR
ncbi:hypothetical protein PF007_g29123 [Phytophthora fragariae]|uniref:Uncharacterized protein n=1 Tax=Phytophthora fragariae TaxID=53985 RepID=A0A6A3PPK3_9STRA|nr:hypothetical protein PF003_g13765 [Phytophthora fragariae]KAE8902290.1 hypothetical protein PF003_g13773 [Phytophthora fragariae]KAE9064641.1 hypothetical protein PF007_g29123 [Phytophthora fragariae]KAE9168835.1 hypothetical protein PF004_g28382 [Phytophthora fragariae]KAE9269700.1 hypothetical protein PF001_g29111 [Phytophthora fragariae]